MTTVRTTSDIADPTLFDDVVTMFSRAHADAAAGNATPLVRLLRTAVVAGQPVIDLAELAPATGFDEAVIDDASMIRRHDLIRNLEIVATHLSTTPSVYRRTAGGLQLAVAARTDIDAAYEESPLVPETFRYVLVAVSGPASAFVVAFGDGTGGIDGVLRCPAGPAVVSGVHPGVGELCRALATVALEGPNG